jgi:outer membrane protein assembly factor BamA
MATFSFARDSAWANPSQVAFGVTYTQNKQVLVFLPFTVFYDNNNYYFNADIGWFRYNFFYYGIGEARVEEELFDVTFPRVRLLASRKVGANTYLGIRYQFEQYDVTRTQEGGELSTGRIAGSQFSRTSSLGLSVLHDTRDSVFYPRKGIFGEFYVLPTSPILGADRTFIRYFADLSLYRSLSKRVVLATNYVGSFTQGKDVPFSQLSMLGGPRKMRGIYEGFFRDANTLLGQAELRWEVWRWVGLAGFGAVGFMGDSAQWIRFQQPKFTYGAGLRLTTQKKNHLNIRLDYGMSPYTRGSFYATIGEAF